jgi:hypothetical protein
MKWETYHVGGSATHIKSNDGNLVGIIVRRLGISHDSTCRSTQNGLMATKIIEGTEPTIGFLWVIEEEECYRRRML